MATILSRRYALDGEKVVDLKTGKPLREFYRNGYKSVNLIGLDGKRRNEYLHRIIASERLDNPDNKPCINHINGIKTDNRLDNLEWCDKGQNNKHAYRAGLRKNGHGGGKNTPIMCIETGVAYQSITIAAEENSLGITALNECLSGRNKTCGRLHWKYI